MPKFGYQVDINDVGPIGEPGFAIYKNGIKVRPPGTLGFKRKSDAVKKMNQLIKQEEEKRKRMEKEEERFGNLPGALPSFEELNDMF